MADIELVVTDLDGTLWHTDDDVHAETRAALDRLAVSGPPVLVATGRRVTSARLPLARIGWQPPAVVLNGALGLDLATGERFHRAPFAATDAVAVLDGWRSVGVDPCVYVDDPSVEVVLGPRPGTHPGHVHALGASAVQGDLDEVVRTMPVLAFSVIGVEHTVAVAVGDAIGTSGGGQAFLDRALDYAGLATVMVAPQGLSKWDGVLSFCRTRGIDPTRVLAIGDGPNDLELLSRAAVSVAPRNGHTSVVDRAHHLVPPPAEGGWAHLLDLV
jgi:hydroxymethylpyrimidine pyrophosphatase-like HAD family hydrolase